MQLKPEHAKLAGYFNMDNGTGAYRGVYLQGNEAVAPIFKQWMAAFANLGMTHLTIRNTGGTDHLSYNAVGLSGFQFIQDEMQYETRTHHTNLDVYDQIVAADMMKNAVITAAFVYQTANREQMLPRKALPKAGAEAGDGAVARQQKLKKVKAKGFTIEASGTGLRCRCCRRAGRRVCRRVVSRVQDPARPGAGASRFVSSACR